jgi:hypothetical protein
MAQPRYTPILDEVWLSSLWDACCSSAIPTPELCSRLARGFVGCNLVMDVVNALAHIADPANHATPVTPGVTFGQLDSWLENPAGADDASRADLVSGPALQSVEDASPHPGQRINLLLVREALGRRLGGPATGTQVSGLALQALASGVPDEPGLPEWCRTRLRAVRDAFSLWWDTSADRLAELLGQWPSLKPLPRDRLTDQVSRRLWCPVTSSSSDSRELLGELVRAKSRQWNLCVGERRFEVPPVSAEWFQEMGGRILSAFFEVPPCAMEFNEADTQNQFKLWHWVQKHNIGAPITMKLPPPEEVGPVQISPLDLEPLLGWWNCIDRYWNQRHETRAYAEDIFGWILPAGTTTPFGDWVRSTQPYWP